MASSSSSSSSYIRKHKTLAISEENCLVEISVPDGPSKILIRHEYQFKKGCSFSRPIDNRYVYMVGGKNPKTGKLSSEVFYYDLIDLNCYQGPSINFPTWQPDLILFGSKLFAFSRLKHISEDCHLICEVLDTASKSLIWCPLKTFPKLPFPRPYGIASYVVVSYAIHSSYLYLSFGNEHCSVSVCYDHCAEKWSNVSETPLPFLDEGKFVGDLCYAFPKFFHTIDNSQFLVAYNLTIDWENEAQVLCEKICTYSLLSDTPINYLSYLHSFYSIDPDTFAILRTMSVDTSTCREEHFFKVDVVRLLHPRQNRKRRSGKDSPIPLVSEFPEEGTSEALGHTSIPLPHALEGILSDYYQ